MLSGLKEYMSHEHHERLKKGMHAHGGEINEFSVDCFTLNEILENSNVSNIDYCSIDTEGSKLEILKAFDFNRFTVKVFSIKNLYISKEIRTLIKKRDTPF